MIADGDDPLGEAFCRIRLPTTRRVVGATYTPMDIVTAMVSWAAYEHVQPARIVDPGAGSGRFLAAAAECFPLSELIAVETDPVASLLLRANATVRRFADRLVVKLADYRSVRLPRIEGTTLFIGNPPYVRHHDIGEVWKDWYARAAERCGIKASKLAGLHLHFFFKTMTLAREGDYGAFITAAEWLDVNYGRALRQLLADGLGGTALHVLDPAVAAFADAATTAAITSFRVGRRPKNLRVRAVETREALNGLTT
ncbi:MAG: Eco57I restriction-modification methylase domain-containing protein, partial [Kiloniellales bacterium]